MDWNGIYGRWVKLSVILIKMGASVVIPGTVSVLLYYLVYRRDWYAMEELVEYAFWPTAICAAQLGTLFLLRWLITGELPKLRK